MILNVLLPASFEAFRYAVSRWASVWLLAMRAYLGQEIAARAMIAFCRPPPSTPATAMAKTRPGNARKISEIRMRTVSARFPCQPQKTPTRVPTAVMTATRSRVEKMLARLPAITRESMSRPYRSVPRRCAAEGAAFALARSCRLGS